MEPEYYYVRDTSSKAAHHWDYLRNRSSRALCGHEYVGPIAYEGPDRPRSVCRACQAALPTYGERWWRDVAKSTQTQLDEIESENKRLKADIKQLKPLSGGWIKLEEPPFYFVRDSVSRVGHHWDYIQGRLDTALCGYSYQGTIEYEGPRNPERVCGECQVNLPRYEAQWWRDTARKTEALRRKQQQRADLARNDLKKITSQLESQNRQLDSAREELANLKRQQGLHRS
jgi:hypothetical protein